MPVSEFLNDLNDTIPAYITGTDGTCLRIFNGNSGTFTKSSLEAEFREIEQLAEDMWQLTQNDELEDALDMEVLHELFSIPRIGDSYFLYFNPSLSTVDTSGMRFVKGLLANEYSAAEHGCLEAAVYDDNAPILEQITIRQFNRLMHYRDVYSSFETVIFSAEKFSFDQYEGRSICFSPRDIEKYLDDNYPLEEGKISRLISTERAAEQAFRSYMERNPERVRKEDAKRMFFSELGSRASIRVWDSVAKDFPFLSKPGRHPGET